MSGSRHGASAAVVLVALAGCAFDSTGAGAGSASVGEETGAQTGGSDSVSSTATGAGSGDATTAGDSADDGPSCEPGTFGCPCEAGVCAGDLRCNQDGTCEPVSCGDGEIQPPEQCDDDNELPDDGCENDCTSSVGAVTVAAGGDHTCIVTFDGRVRCWGAGEDGRTGQGGVDDLGDDELPSEGVDLPFEAAVAAIGLGEGFGCALLDNATVACWGKNANGRLGLGTTDPAVLEAAGDKITPVALEPLVVAMSVGREHACVVQEGGAVRCWGKGDKGRLGYGPDPAIIGGDIGDDEQPGVFEPVALGGPARALAAGTEHTCALLENGTVRCWGARTEGRLGVVASEDIGDDEDPTVIDALDFGGAPVKAIAADGHHSCAVVGDDDELWCWGKGSDGRLGTGATVDALPTKIATGGRVLELAIGSAHTCVVLSQVVWRDVALEQAVRCFGDASLGRLGTGDEIDVGGTPETTPEKLRPIDVRGGARQRITALSLGDGHGCVRTTGGDVRCWGFGAEGRLGYGNTEDIGDDEPPSVAGTVAFE